MLEVWELELATEIVLTLHDRSKIIWDAKVYTLDNGPSVEHEYRVRVSRKETFSLSPMDFEQAEQVHYSCFVMDDLFDEFECRSKTARDALDQLLAQMRHQLLAPDSNA